LIVGPPAALFVTRRICIGLQEHDLELAVHGYETGRVVRLPDGGYVEEQRPVDAYRRWTLAGFTRIAPTQLAAADHRISSSRRLRVRLANFFDQDRLVASAGQPVSATPGKPAIGGPPKTGADQQS
jgi:ubiquinol-cytochrome c reductase cytochrome b subunit